VQAVEQAGARLSLQARDRADAQGRAARLGPDQGLHQLAAAPLQEARLQELQQHLSALADPPPLQHSGQCAGAGVARPVRQLRHGAEFQVLSEGPQDGADSDGQR